MPKFSLNFLPLLMLFLFDGGIQISQTRPQPEWQYPGAEGSPNASLSPPKKLDGLQTNISSNLLQNPSNVGPNSTLASPIGASQQQVPASNVYLEQKTQSEKKLDGKQFIHSNEGGPLLLNNNVVEKDESELLQQNLVNTPNQNLVTSSLGNGTSTLMRSEGAFQNNGIELEPEKTDPGAISKPIENGLDEKEKKPTKLMPNENLTNSQSLPEKKLNKEEPPKDAKMMEPHLNLTLQNNMTNSLNATSPLPSDDTDSDETSSDSDAPESSDSEGSEDTKEKSNDNSRIELPASNMTEPEKQQEATEETKETAEESDTSENDENSGSEAENKTDEEKNSDEDIEKEQNSPENLQGNSTISGSDSLHVALTKPVAQQNGKIPEETITKSSDFINDAKNKPISENISAVPAVFPLWSISQTPNLNKNHSSVDIANKTIPNEGEIPKTPKLEQSFNDDTVNLQNERLPEASKLNETYDEKQTSEATKSETQNDTSPVNQSLETQNAPLITGEDSFTVALNSPKEDPKEELVYLEGTTEKQENNRTLRDQSQEQQRQSIPTTSDGLPAEPLKPADPSLLPIHVARPAYREEAAAAAASNIGTPVPTPGPSKSSSTPSSTIMSLAEDDKQHPQLFATTPLPIQQGQQEQKLNVVPSATSRPLSPSNQPALAGPETPSQIYASSHPAPNNLINLEKNGTMISPSSNTPPFAPPQTPPSVNPIPVPPTVPPSAFPAPNNVGFPGGNRPPPPPPPPSAFPSTLDTAGKGPTVNPASTASTNIETPGTPALELSNKSAPSTPLAISVPPTISPETLDTSMTKEVEKPLSIAENISIPTTIPIPTPLSVDHPEYREEAGSSSSPNLIAPGFLGKEGIVPPPVPVIPAVILPVPVSESGGQASTETATTTTPTTTTTLKVPPEKAETQEKPPKTEVVVVPVAVPPSPIIVEEKGGPEVTGKEDTQGILKTLTEAIGSSRVLIQNITLVLPESASSAIQAFIEALIRKQFLPPPSEKEQRFLPPPPPPPQNPQGYSLPAQYSPQQQLPPPQMLPAPTPVVPPTYGFGGTNYQQGYSSPIPSVSFQPPQYSYYQQPYRYPSSMNYYGSGGSYVPVQQKPLVSYAPTTIFPPITTPQFPMPGTFPTSSYDTDYSIPPPPKQYLVEPEELHSWLKAGRPGIRLLDANYEPDEPVTDFEAFNAEFWGKLDRLIAEKKNRLFERSHIPGAVPFNLNIATYPSWSETQALYPVDLFEQYVRRLGVNAGDQIVVYARGQLSGMMQAARVWFLFRIYGHEDVLVLNGGLDAWLRIGLPSTDEAVPPVEELGDWRATFNGNLMVTFDQLTTLEKDGYCVLSRLYWYNFLDARPRAEFFGVNDPTRAGSQQQQQRRNWITGSKAFPADELVLSVDGHLIPAGEISRKLQAINFDPKNPTIVAGNTPEEASLVLLALAQVQETSARLYNGGIDEIRRRAPEWLCC